MKTLLSLFIAVILIGCNTNVKHPTPFVASDTVVKIYGCEKLKQEVEEYNKKNPVTLKKADC